jgi:Zn-dependent protease with chaperone function
MQQGGVEAPDGAGQGRLNRVTMPLLAAYGGGINVRVLGSDRSCAYAWPGGEVFVTRGLMRILNDDELAAAVAHELGHLMADSTKVTTAATLAPRAEAGADEERRADALGAILLERAGVGANQMTRMLERVADRGGLSAAEQRAMRSRAVDARR